MKALKTQQETLTFPLTERGKKKKGNLDRGPVPRIELSPEISVNTGQVQGCGGGVGTSLETRVTLCPRLSGGPANICAPDLVLHKLDEPEAE